MTAPRPCHELRTWPVFFDAIWRGEKTHELRYDDRSFSTGDLLVLREWHPSRAEYTGRGIEAYVSHITRAPGLEQDVQIGCSRKALGAGWVVMSIIVVRRWPT